MYTATGFVEVTQGLAEGDVLVVLGAEPLSDGVPVKISQRTTMEAFDAGAQPASTATSGPSTVKAEIVDGGRRP
jgi:hypothetical protein